MNLQTSLRAGKMSNFETAYQATINVVDVVEAIMDENASDATKLADLADAMHAVRKVAETLKEISALLA